MKAAKEAKLVPEDVKVQVQGMQPKLVLANEFTQEPVLEEFFVGIVRQKKDISKAIKSIGNILQLPNHLKRCSGNKLLLAPVKQASIELQSPKVSFTKESLKSFLRDSEFDLSIIEDEFEVVIVSEAAPKTKAQANIATKFWPVNFHPDVELEALLSGSYFEESVLVSLQKCMHILIKAAQQEAVGNDHCNGSAMVICPENDRILALATSKIDRHPMWHAAMIAVDLVAKLQGGGAWNLEDDQSSFNNRQFDMENHEKNKEKPIKRKCDKSSPICYPSSLINLIPDENTLTFKVHNGKKSRSKIDDDSIKDTKSKDGPYLCTNYWVLLLQEPCPLCAMALLHSRVFKIFYGAHNTSSGILGSKATLHSVPGLNHRYQVWNGILEKECTETLKACRRKNS